MIHKYLSKADFLSQSPSVNFKGKSRMSSAFGGVLTIMFACFTALATVYIGQELVLRQSPSLVFESKRNDESKVLLSDYPLAFRFNDFNGFDLGTNQDFLNSMRVTVRINNITPEGLKGGVFEVKDCDESFIDSTFLQLAKETRPNRRLFCPDFSKGYATPALKEPSNADLYITKGFGQVGFSFMSFTISVCKGDNCKPFKHLNDVYYTTLIVLDGFAEISDYENPIKRTVSTVTGQVSDAFYTRQYIEIDQNYLITDDNWFISQESRELYYSIGKKSYEIAEYSEDFRALYQFTFTSPAKDNITKRRYVKLPEIMAFVGGFAKAVLLGFKIFLSFYTDYWMKVEVLELLKEEKPSNFNSSSEVIQIESRSKQSINPSKPVEKAKISHFKQFVASLFFSSHPINRKYDLKVSYLDILRIMKTVKTVEEMSTSNRPVVR